MLSDQRLDVRCVAPIWLMWPWWVKIPNEDFTDETLAIDDTFGDDVRGGDGGGVYGSWQVDKVTNMVEIFNEDFSDWWLLILM